MIGHVRGMLGLALVASVVVGCASWQKQQPTGPGMFVGQYKLYDDSFLEAQVAAAKQRLAALSTFDQPSLVSHFGAVQGGSSVQSGLSVQAIGAPSPKVTTTTGGDKGPTTQSEQGSLTPSAPSASGSSLTLPSSFSVSSIDILNEQMQLMYQLTSWQLLLDGAINDRLQLKGGATKRVTMGFPVTIEEAPAGRENSAAEIEVTVCGAPPRYSRPSIVNILPLDNTYNSVTLSSDSKSFGVGALAGVFSVGVGWFNSKQKYYLVKHQDTLAIQREPAADIKCKAADAQKLTFAWDFFPQPGSAYVRGGMRQTFVQLALPNQAESLCDTQVHVRTAWRPIDVQTGAVGSPEFSPELAPKNLVEYDATPYSFEVSVADLGAGNVLVRANGSFLAAPRVRVGGVLLDSNSVGYAADRRHVQFIVPAASLMAGGVQLVGSDGTEHDLQYWPPVADPYSTQRCTSEELRSASTAPALPRPAYQLCGQTFSNPVQIMKICKVEVAPYSDSMSRVHISLDWMPKSARAEYIRHKWYVPDQETPFRLVAMVGGKIFGLTDAPFAEKSAPEFPSTIDVIVSNDALRASPQVMVRRLMMGPEFKSEYVGKASDFSIAGLSLISTEGAIRKYAVKGTNLDGVKLLQTSGGSAHDSSFETVSPSLGVLTISETLAKSTKQLLFRNGVYVTAVALPDGSPEATGTAVKLEELKQPIASGTTQLKINGSNLSQVGLIKYLDQTVNFVVASDGSSLSVDLPAAVTGSEGVRYLDVIAVDKSISRYAVKVAKKQ